MSQIESCQTDIVILSIKQVATSNRVLSDLASETSLVLPVPASPLWDSFGWSRNCDTGSSNSNLLSMIFDYVLPWRFCCILTMKIAEGWLIFGKGTIESNHFTPNMDCYNSWHTCLNVSYTMAHLIGSSIFQWQGYSQIWRRVMKMTKVLFLRVAAPVNDSCSRQVGL